MTATAKKKGSLLQYPFVMCRAVTGHHWEMDATRLPKAPPASKSRYGWSFDSPRCGMSKDVFYDQEGYTVYTRYRQPSGYKTSAERTTLRLTLLEAKR